MALTTEQQAEVDKQVQAEIAAMQTSASAKESERSRRLQCLNIAYTTLLENKRNLPVEQRQITPAEITAFADTLVNYANS